MTGSRMRNLAVITYCDACFRSKHQGMLISSAEFMCCHSAYNQVCSLTGFLNVLLNLGQLFLRRLLNDETVQFCFSLSILVSGFLQGLKAIAGAGLSLMIFYPETYRRLVAATCSRGWEDVL